MAARRGWKPRWPGDVRSLGWGVLQFTHDMLRSPLDEDQPFLFTAEQASDVVRIYELDEHGRRVYGRRAHEERPKGWGKSPFAAAIDITEFAGPVCFDGWDADGQPVGVSWGTKGRPAPWIQVAAVSEAQTANTWNALFAMLMANSGKVAESLNIDPGRTLVHRTDMPGAFMERVTASAGTREGQPITHATLDEPQLWLPSNGGTALASTILRNLAKMGGWGLLTGNAPVMGLGSVAEIYAKRARGALRLAPRPAEEPQRDWTRAQMRKVLKGLYAGAYWIDIERLIDDITDDATPWPESKRFFFNWPDTGRPEDAWMSEDAWAGCEGEPRLSRELPAYACVRIGHGHGSAAVVIAQKQGEQVVMLTRTFDGGDGYVAAGDIEDHISGLHRDYPARVTAEVRFRAGGKAYQRQKPGPLVLHHGAFFEPSRQRLEKAGVVTLDVPSSPERTTPAAESLMGLVTAGNLVHDGDEELATQMTGITAKQRPKGWAIGSDGPMTAAQAAMLAVHWALTTKTPPSRRVRGLR